MTYERTHPPGRTRQGEGERSPKGPSTTKRSKPTAQKGERSPKGPSTTKRSKPTAQKGE
jgi:hypothetical protein